MNNVMVVPSIPCLGVTDDGRVMNMISGKWLSVCDNGHGYKQVFVCVKNKRYMRYVHRLVAECYIPNPNNLAEVNHKDGDKANNNASNLEWCTSSENKRHAQKLGLRNNRTPKQIAASRANARKSRGALFEGWKKWAKTDAAREQWLKNLKNANRWHKDKISSTSSPTRPSAASTN